jgi:4-hydroxyphenylacetate 3-hydroxylase, reductase component
LYDFSYNLQAMPANPVQTSALAVAPAATSADEAARALALRHAFGRYATGVTVITTLDAGGAPVGLTANSFTSLSLSPPLVLWALRLSSPTRQIFEDASRFVVNVLSEAQSGLSRRFATAMPDKFSGLDWVAVQEGLPAFHDCAARFECRTVSHQIAGDHVLFIGEVLAFEANAHAPLVYQGGRYRELGGELA